MRESPSQEKRAADSAGPAPEQTSPERVLQEVARASAPEQASPERVLHIDRLVANMQPLAQPATVVDNAWLSQVRPFEVQDEPQARALTASASYALAQIRANTTALQNGVINPFIQYWRARLSQTFVREIGQFGSRSYGLALAATSDFDIVCSPSINTRPPCATHATYARWPLCSTHAFQNGI